MERFKKPPNLTHEEEELLRGQLEKVWLAVEGGDWKYKGANNIASAIDIGEKNWIFRIKPEYVYYYRIKFGLPKRREGAIKKGKTRYKSGSLRLQDLTSLDEFSAKLRAIPPVSFNNRRKRVFNILVFYTGLRKGEVLMLRRKNFEIYDAVLIINAFREKKGLKSYVDSKAKKDATYSVHLSRDWKYVDELVSWIERFDNDEDKVFNFSPQTAWSYVKEVFADKYPHYYRMNRISYLCNQTDMTLAEIQRFTGLHLATIQKYITKGERLAETTMKKIKF